ncbi:hypothetical protein [Oryzobacter terrae]|uniref:hypothetical protein n=1 Tax=Oryzobacter terrae TaxID=1620385 RepID=UPI0036733810
MTTPGGWPPPETRAPYAPTGTPQPTGPWTPAAFPPRPGPGARDQTARTIGIIGLVVAVVALLAQLLVVVLPGLFFVPLVFGAGGLFADEGWAEGPLPSTTSAFVGGVALGSGRSVDGVTLADAVEYHGGRTGALESTPSPLRCDDVDRATTLTSVLCRAADGAEWYAVVRFTDDSGSFVVTVVTDFEDPW